MKSVSSKSAEVECAAVSEATHVLREILGISMNEDMFDAGEAVARISALAERALQHFEEISLASGISSRR